MIHCTNRLHCYFIKLFPHFLHLRSDQSRTVPQTNTSMTKDMVSSKCVFIRKNLNLLLQRLFWEEKLPGDRVQLCKSDVGVKAHSSICVGGVQPLQPAVEVLQHGVQNLQGIVLVFKAYWINQNSPHPSEKKKREKRKKEKKNNLQFAPHHLYPTTRSILNLEQRN